MKKRLIIFILALVVLILIYKQINIYDNNKKDINVLILPSLPQPIAKENVLITSAGQSIDAYIIYDAANKLTIHSYFMPMATENDLEGVNSIVFVVGNSFIGQRFYKINYYEEKNRLVNILNRAKKEKKSVITVFLGGYERRNKKEIELLNILCSSTDYLIATKSSDKDKYISKLAKNNKIPLTLINKTSDILEPFLSAFR